jgi:glycosyltransferase involved in cell wall biosynthesis
VFFGGELWEMKVLMVHKTRIGGVAIHVKEISSELRKIGIKVDEITRNEDLELRSFLHSYTKMKKLFSKWSKEYDIIHCHDWSITYPALKANIKNLVATFHGFPLNIVANYFENYCIKKLREKAIVVSPKMKKIYKNATLIPNGVNLSIFKKYRNIKRLKNLVGLAQQYNLDKITNVLKKLGMNFVCTNGKLKYEDLGKFYSKIEIFISIPYEAAGFNMVWLEAMACEVPYIIGTNAGIGEILPIYKISSFNELKNLLSKIRKKKIKPLRNQRRWIIKNGMTWKRHVNQLINLYRRVMNKEK